MKKMILALAATTLLAGPVFADTQQDDFKTQEQFSSELEVFDLEPGAMSDVDAAELYAPQTAVSSNMTTFGRGDDLARGIIGGIIGAIADQAYDRDHRGRGYRGQVTCFAQNKRGQTFRAVGNRAGPTQQAALKKCYNNSKQCRAAGCR